MKQKRSSTIKRSLLVLFFIVIALFLATFPLPYFIEGPGSAENIDPMIHIQGQENDEQGTYMLTTVSIRQATPLTYFMDLLPFYDRVTEEELFGTLDSHEEYQTLQNYYMTSSIHSALQAAYKAADRPSELSYEGVYVMSVKEQSDFNEKLAPGDIILSVDGNKFRNSQEFIDYVKNLEAGQTIKIDYTRKNEQKQAEGKLVFLEETKQPGIGISLVDHTVIHTDPEAEIEAGQIGGPSAGMMFALRTYTILKELSLSQNYQIAGTGTIDPEGNVGRIGGIDKKIVAADKQGAAIFFAPEDEITEDMRKVMPDIKTNYEEALAAAKAIGTKMKVIPIQTLQDAIDYLEQLP